MELKRILAKDIRRATEKAVALYGQDVLFVSNSRVNGMTEVIVAVDVAPEPWAESADRGDGERFGQVLQQSFKAMEKGATAPESAEDDAEVGFGHIQQLDGLGQHLLLEAFGLAQLPLSDGAQATHRVAAPQGHARIGQHQQAHHPQPRFPTSHGSCPL